MAKTEEKLANSSIATKINSCSSEKKNYSNSVSQLTCCNAVKQRQDTDGLPLLCHDGRVNLRRFLKRWHHTTEIKKGEKLGQTTLKKKYLYG